MSTNILLTILIALSVISISALVGVLVLAKQNASTKEKIAELKKDIAKEHKKKNKKKKKSKRK